MIMRPATATELHTQRAQDHRRAPRASGRCSRSRRTRRRAGGPARSRWRRSSHGRRRSPPRDRPPPSSRPRRPAGHLIRQSIRAEPQRDDEDGGGDHDIGGRDGAREPGTQHRNHRDARADDARRRAPIDRRGRPTTGPSGRGRHDGRDGCLSRRAERDQASPLRARLGRTIGAETPAEPSSVGRR